MAMHVCLEAFLVQVQVLFECYLCLIYIGLIMSIVRHYYY